MNTRRRTIALLTAAALLLPAATSFAITCEALQDRIANGDVLTIIDIRSPKEFAEGHLPSAINVPFAIVAQKSLPPVGEVIVYGDGLDTGRLLEATAHLNAKEGITAEPLLCGFSRWSALGNATTAAKGLTKRAEHLLLYDQFQRAVASNTNVVLIDLRLDRYGRNLIKRNGGPVNRQPNPDGSTGPQRPQTPDTPSEPAPDAQDGEAQGGGERTPSGSDAEPAPTHLTADGKFRVLEFTAGEDENFWVLDDGRGLADSIRRRLGGQSPKALEIDPDQWTGRVTASENDPKKFTIDTRSASAPDVAPRLSLRSRYPQARILNADFAFLDEGAEKEMLYGRMLSQLDRTQHRDFYVIIDRGHGRAAQRMVERMWRAGIHRVAVLAGGEEILLNDGKPIIQRERSQ